MKKIGVVLGVIAILVAVIGVIKSLNDLKISANIRIGEYMA